jgi:RNA polymerase sigma-70 factor, ECF subfamily
MSTPPQPTHDDSPAIRRLKSGDMTGLEDLVARYQVQAVRAAFMITGDAAAAEDIVQDTFLRITQRIRQYDEARPFAPYLLRCVINAALNTQRQAKHTSSLDGDPAYFERLLSQAASIEALVEYQQRQQEILEALWRLSPRHRAAVVQRYYLGMSEQEMAQTLRVAPGTVKWLLNAARARLKELLGIERSVE